MAYTTIDKPTDYFETLLWTGNGNTPRTFTGLDFAPNMTWSKRRDDAAGHNLLDTVRGAGVDSELCPSTNGIEGSNNANTYGYLSAFTSDGFTVTAGSSDNAYWNNNTATYVSWNWKAGTSFSNDASATSVGSIDSAGSVNTTAGFSIIGYSGAGDGTASSAQTVAHGLGVAPTVIIVKNRADSTNWYTYHHKNTAAPATDVLYLNLTNATGDDNGPWNDVAPSSSVFTVGGDNGTNGNGDNMIAYCLAEKKGYSKFGTYTGNGNADGTFVYTGFKPSFVMNKKTDGTMDWHIWDNKRNSFNVIDKLLYPNLNNAEDTLTSLDFVSNGFKIRDNRNFLNTSGSPYIFIAFAENPFVNSNGIPNNAR